MNAHIFQLSISNGGVPKHAVREATVTPTGFEGDRQANTRFHGGPLRALCLYPLEQITKLQGEGHPIYPGSIGENVTVVGLDWSQIVPGARLALGDEVQIEITSYTAPCKNIGASFRAADYDRISQKTHPGEARVYARILRTGRLVTGQKISVLEAAT